MKKSRERKRHSSSARGGSTRMRRAERRRAKPAEVGQVTRKAQAISRQAQTLLHRASDLKNKADAIHRTAHQAHEDVHGLHSKVHHQKSTLGQANAESHAPVTAEHEGGRATPFPIVGVGASAGGFEAFQEFLRDLPKDTGMAFVLVQHLDPKYRSRLSELLGYNAPLRVVEVRHGTKVKPDTIYVMPENVLMTLSNGQLHLKERNDGECPSMPIDLFFRSLATEQEHRAIGVVLSGTGTDGSLGVEAIKGAGGITFAQDEASAKYFGMPGSAIAAGSVDMVLSPAAIANELGRISRHPFLEPAQAPAVNKTPPDSVALERVLGESSKELQTLFRLLRARTGVDFSLYKHSTLKRRIIRRMILHKSAGLPDYVRKLEADPAELDLLFRDLLINVTSFFRDAAGFQLLKTKVFPRLMKAHPDDLPLRFWVCGCATGEEAYSLAIILTEYFEQTHSHRQIQIFATDVSDSGIEKARAGIYPENITQDVSPERLRRFFSKGNGNYQVHKAIRDICVFARQNVLVDPPFSNLDLVCCRNVMIYFGPALQRKLIPVFHYALRPTGFLWLGSSETIGPSTEMFTLVNKKFKLYLKKPSFLRPHFDIAQRIHEKQPEEHRAAPAKPASREAVSSDLQHQVDRILLREFSPGAVVVTSELEVVQFRGRTGDYLEHAPGAPSLNLLKMVRESIVMDLRAALNRAIKHNMTVKTTGVHLRHNGRSREIAIEVVPFTLASLSEKFFLVAFKELDHAPPGESSSPPKEPPGLRRARERREVYKLRSELVATKESMQSIIEEQEATNEELKSANEEIQSSNEELQSTNEELEKAKEELQSTNEELTTLNEELQNRNTELSQTNNDLMNLLASVNIAVLMVSDDLTIRRFTPVAERIFNLIPSDVGRRLGDMNRTILVPDLESTVRRVIETLVSVEREVQDRSGHWYSLRVRPYRTRENRIQGAVIILVEIDELNRVVDGVLATVSQPVLVLGPDLRIRHANDAFRKSFQQGSEEPQGKLVYELASGGWDLPPLHRLFEEVLPQQKQVAELELEANLDMRGPRRFRLYGRRFFEEGRGMQMILVAIETPN